MARRQFSRGFSPRSGTNNRRLTSWSLGPGGDDIATLDREAFNSTETLIIGQGVTPLIDNLTIVRIHGHMEAELTAADAQRTGFNVVAGIGIVTSDAFTAGVASMPDPFADTDWPGWMWQTSFSLRTSVAALAVGDPQNNGLHIPIEGKSMRKLRLNEVLFLTVAAGETGVAVMDIAAYTRILVKLP